MRLALAAALAIATLALPVQARQKPVDIEARLAALEARVQRHDDEDAIRKLAFSYAYYMDNALMEEVEALFSTRAEYCEIAGYGLYRGHAGCMKIWREILGPGLQNADGHLRFGRLIKHYLVKDVIDVAPDGKTAQGRFDYIGFSGVFNEPARTTQQLGVYRMAYVKEDGVWKIARFSLSFDTSDWNDRDWAKATAVRCPRPGAPKPDAPPLFAHPFPETGVVPFHYPNPVTGKPIAPYVNRQRYWQGNGPDDFGQACGVRPGAPTALEPARPAPGAR